MQHFAVGGYAMFKRFATLLALVPLAWLLVPASAEAG
jgi:heme exporter protein D